MAQDHLYREEGLSLGRLAQHLGLPEYRLRRLIHQHLGHRHFSAYLHSLRLAEACAHLSDRTQAQRAVLDIALAVGFQSIGPFNRAFKAHTGLTPTEFRRQHLADS
jgi:AraC-like DNA-binding protein